jgi:hypothetical protein
MTRFYHLYRYVNMLSLDIVAGAVIGALFFSHLFSVEILPYGLAALALTVWIIYTIDHLRDARSIKHFASTERHRFHQQHFRVLTIVVCTAILTDSVLILFMRKPVFEWGLILSGIVILYLVVQQYLRVLKELFVAILYTCGVLLPSIAITPPDPELLQTLLIIQFVFIAWINLLIFSWFDQENDLRDQQISFATLCGKRVTAILIFSLSGLQLGMGIMTWQNELYRTPVILFSLMTLILLVVFASYNQKNRSDSFRLLGDAVFFIPGVYLLWIRI